MKSIKKLCAVLLALPLFAAFTACSEDEASYSGASKPTNAQVYFADLGSTTIEADKDASSTTLQIYRLNTKGELQVPLASNIKSADAQSAYTIPSSVTFADGDSVANITITYDNSKVDYGKFDTITVAIADETLTTPYASSTFDGLIGVSEPYSDWDYFNEAKTATFQENLAFGAEVDQVPFLYRQNTINTNKMQFMLVDPLGFGVDFVFDYDKTTGYVTMAPTYSGYNHASYGPLYFADHNTYWLDVRKQELNADQYMYGSFDEEQGIIAIPMVAYVSAGYFDDNYNYIYLDGYDRKDYSVGVSYKGKITYPNDETRLLATVTLGEDVSKVRVGILPDEDDLTQDDITSLVNGTSAYPFADTEEAGDVELDPAKLLDGTYTLVAISYDGNDVPQNVAVESFNYSTAGNKSSWDLVYSGQYGASIMFEDEKERLYDYAIYQNADDPTQFRIPGWCFAGKDSEYNSGKVNFTFTMDETGSVMVDDITTDIDFGEGKIHVQDLVGYTNGNTKYGESSFDATTNTFNFALVYFLDQERLYNYGMEHFYVGGASQAANRAMAAARLKNMLNKKAHRAMLVKTGYKQPISLRK